MCMRSARVRLTAGPGRVDGHATGDVVELNQALSVKEELEEEVTVTMSD